MSPSAVDVPIVTSMRTTVSTVRKVVKEALQRDERRISEGKKDPEKVKKKYLKHGDPDLRRCLRWMVDQVLDVSLGIGREAGQAGIVSSRDRRIVDVVESSADFWFISEDLRAVPRDLSEFDVDSILSHVAEECAGVINHLLTAVFSGDLDNGQAPGTRFFREEDHGAVRFLSLPPDEVVDEIVHDIHAEVVDRIRDHFDFSKVDEFDKRWGIAR